MSTENTEQPDSVNEAERQARFAASGLLGDYQRVCELIGSIYFYGNFRAETANERELEALLRKLGYFFDSEEQLMAKLHSPNITIRP